MLFAFFGLKQNKNEIFLRMYWQTLMHRFLIATTKIGMEASGGSALVTSLVEQLHRMRKELLCVIW